jgi:signal transduction histidine kinase
MDDQMLRGYVREIAAITRLPHQWIGQSPATISSSLMKVLQKLLNADAMLVEVRHPDTGAPLVSVSGASELEIDTAIRRAAGERATLVIAGEALPATLVVCPLGLDGDLGRVVVGALRREFPTALDWLVLQAAGNEVISALRSSALELRRHRSEAELVRQTTARRHAQRDLHVQRDLIALIGHELRTPLAAVHGYLDLFDADATGPLTDAQRQYLARIRTSSEYLTHLVRNVFEYSRLSRGVLETAIDRVRIFDVADRVMQLVWPQLQAKGLRFERSADVHGLDVRADPDKLQLILVNLLTNAAKYTDTGGRVALSWSADDAMVHIRVSDTGHGIPQDELDHVFEPFVRLKGAGHVDGSGLGLAIARRLAVAMNGRIDVESRFGEGSTFTITLPRAASTSTRRES